MKKEDLRTGMVVVLRGYANNSYVVMHNCKGMDRLVAGNGYLSLDDYDDTLIDCTSSEWDIIRVYLPDCFSIAGILNVDNHDLIWEREDKKEMTVADVECALGHGVKIIKG